MIDRLLRRLAKLDPRRQQARVRELLASRAADGPYRFLVRSWGEVGEIELARRLIESGYFTNQLDPVPLPVATASSFVVLAPHQDDETIGAGGLMLLARKAGVSIDIVFVTNGAQIGKGHAPSVISEIRDREATGVCAKLGAAHHHLGIDNIEPRPTPADVEALRALLARLRPRVILTPWILDQPPKHRLVTHLLGHALQTLPNLDAEVWHYQVHGEIFPNGFVDITEVADEKRRLLRMYRSQVEHVQAYDHVVAGRDAWNSRYLPTDPRPRSVELYFTLPSAESARLTTRTYERDLFATYRGDRALATAMTNLRLRMGPPP